MAGTEYGMGYYGSGFYRGFRVAAPVEPATPEEYVNTFPDPIIDAMNVVMTDDFMIYIRAVGEMFKEVEFLARDTLNGEVGWSVLVDLNRIPNKGLPYIAQFLGTGVVPGLTDEEQRDRIRASTNLERGTVDQIKRAAALHLTGRKTVVFRERDHAACPAEPPYGLTIITYASETPDPAQTLKDIIAQKPAGIVLRYVTATGQDYDQLYHNNASYGVVYTKYATYQGVVEDQPGA
jgi:hypothetical protein